MPNWVEQNLHVVGSKADVDRFIATGYSRRSKEQFDNLLDLHRLCPLKSRESRKTYTHGSAVVLVHFRTRTQACQHIVQLCLDEAYQPGMTAVAQFASYQMFGDDPFIVALEDASAGAFSAWDYARARSAEMCQQP